MSQAPLFNAQILSELAAELGAENTAEVMHTFLVDTERKMSAISASTASRTVVKSEAHAIKSSAATFGFDRLSRLARELETGAPAMDADILAAAIHAILQAFAATRELAKTTLLPRLREIA